MYRFNCLLVLVFIYNFVSVLSSSNVTVDDFPDSYFKYVQGNSLWTGLLKDCKQQPTMVCIQNQVFKYLKETLDYPDDVQFTSFMKFSKNDVDYNRISRSLNLENETEGIHEDEYTSPVEEMSRSLQGNTMKFLMTHNLELQLPETIFQGATLKLSPRSLEGNGAMVKLEFLPKEYEAESRAVGEERTLKLIKKIRKFIGERLMYALMAILMVIKLLSVKFLFILPAVMGVAAAKKLIFKLLLFVFPALSHLFKWCAYVPHGTKFHHHKHHIAHYHHLTGGHPHKPPGHYEVIAPHDEGPPSLHHSFDTYDAPEHHKDYYNPHESELEYGFQGPAFGDGYITHRQDPLHGDNEIHPWGHGQENRRTKTDSFGKPLPPSEIENMILKAEKEALIKARLQQEKQKIHEENLRLQEQLNKALKLQSQLKQASAVNLKSGPTFIQNTPLSPPPLPPNSFKPPPNFLQTPVNVPPPPQNNINPSAADKVSITYENQPGLTQEQQRQIAELLARKNREKLAEQKSQVAALIAREQMHQAERKQNQFNTHVADLTAANPKNTYEQELLKAAAITYDPFYSPILDKIDKILSGLGFNEEPCRERLICSMYKNPTKFSPHSNLLSAELSRDSRELQKPKVTNAAVIRFYKYVQAARDGQDKRDCLRLYPACSVNTEQ